MKHHTFSLTRRNVLTALAALTLSASVAGARVENTSGVDIPKKPALDAGNPQRYGLGLARHADRYDSGWVDQYVKGRLTLYDARGDKVVREINQLVLEGDQGNKSLVRFLTPADIRGVAALIHEHPKSTDDTWLYLPASRRTRRISGANRTASFQGTEFTYEDLSSFEVDRYTWRYLSDSTTHGQPVHLLEARPRYSDTGYQKLVVHLHKEHFRGERVEFFDLSGRRLKTLEQSKWAHVHGRFWRATRQEMNNHQTHKRTVLDIDTLFVNLALYPKSDGSSRSNLTAERFTKRALEG